jgi:uncharacterized BrkB/YihY/UPF0761 family membrane protein
MAYQGYDFDMSDPMDIKFLADMFVVQKEFRNAYKNTDMVDKIQQCIDELLVLLLYFTLIYLCTLLIYPIDALTIVILSLNKQRNEKSARLKISILNVSILFATIILILLYRKLKAKRKTMTL